MTLRLPLPLVLLGSGGHARVLLSLLRAAGNKVVGVCDPRLSHDAGSSWEGLEIIGDDTVLAVRYRPNQVALVLGVGKTTADLNRERLYETWRDRGYHFPALVHPAAWVAQDAVLESGVQIMAGAIVQPGCFIGENSIINTRVSVDHDCKISRNVHIAPGATLCGSVNVASGAFIGAGAVIIQNIHVGEYSVVGAGTTLVRDLDARVKIISDAKNLKIGSSCN